MRVKKLDIPQKFTAILVYGRPPLVFAGMLCAIAVMWSKNYIPYTFGAILLFISMTFDLIDGWFDARFRPFSTFSNLADRIMDKIVYSIIFPLVSVGVMWRFFFFSHNQSKPELLHALFVFFVCITVLMRDNFAHFMRGFATRKGQEPEFSELARLRTIIAAPFGLLLYIYAFYVPSSNHFFVYNWLTWLANLPLHVLFIIEILFLIINFGSIAVCCRKYGSFCLDEICLGHEFLRRRILSFFPNSLTFMNAMMGLMAVFFAYQGQIREAYLLLIGAALFDKLDGALARKLGLTEPMENDNRKHKINVGSIMDDIADGISFCMAPALILYITYLRIPDSMHHQYAYFKYIHITLISILYAVLGIARLVYFTLDKKPIPGFFKGLPSPAAALAVTAPLIMLVYSQQANSSLFSFWVIFCPIFYLFSAILMNVYPIHYLHLGRFMNRKPMFGRMTGLILIFALFTPYFGYCAFIYMFLYILSPLVTWRIDPKVAGLEIKIK